MWSMFWKYVEILELDNVMADLWFPPDVMS